MATPSTAASRSELTDHAAPINPSAYWELLMNLTKREVKGRYSQSLFGFGWAIAQPLATMAVFTFVFSYLIMLGHYRIELQDRHGLTHDEAKKARDNFLTIQRLKSRMAPIEKT